MAGKVIDLYTHIRDEFMGDHTLERKVQVHLGTLVTQLFTQTMNNDQGFCQRFTLPLLPIQQLFKMVNLDPVKVELSFRTTWKYPKGVRMFSDSYYHILLLMIYYGLKHNNETLVNHSLLLLLLKIWNGRKAKFVKYCDEKIMRYVVTHMVSRKHLINKYDTPLNLLNNYFVPTLLKKYGPEIKRDSNRLKNLFMQAWSRIAQVFSQNPRLNPVSGKREAQGGIAPLYYKAYREGLSVTNPSVRSDDEKGPGFEDYATVHVRDDIAQSTTDYICLNSNPTYAPTFISSVNSITHVSVKILDQMFKAMHNNIYHDYINDLLIIMLSKLSVSNKEDICKPVFKLDVKKKIISSKNNPDARKIQQLLDKLIINIFKNNFSNISFDKYSNVNKIQIRNSMIYAIIQNLTKNICVGQIQRSAFRRLR